MQQSPSSRASHLRAIVVCTVLGLIVATCCTARAQQLTADEQAALVLNGARRAFNEKNYPFAIERFREFLKQHGGHPAARDARFGLGRALLEGSQKDFQGALDALQPLEGDQGFADRPLVLYYLGYAQRGLGNLELAQGVAKPQEAAQRRQAAMPRFDQAAQKFSAAVVAFAARLNAAAPASDAPVYHDWLARSGCDLAEMLLQQGKFEDARKAADRVLTEPATKAGRYQRLAAYYSGYASFSLKDYVAAGRTLGPLSPFGDPVFGVHVRYLLARTHHLAGERPEAAVHYAAVLAEYEKGKSAAQVALQNAQALKDQPDEKARLETLVKSPPPDYVARGAFFWAVLLCEQSQYADALPLLAAYPQKYAASALLKDAALRQGICQVQLKQFPDAIRTLQPLLDQPPLADQALWWTARAQLRMADVNNAPALAEAQRAAAENLRKAAERAQQSGAADAAARLRRGEILLELADTQQAARQFAEAAATCQTILNDKDLASRAAEALERQTAAYQLAGRFKESDDACQKFQQSYPQSTLLPAVLFRHAENAYLTAAAAGQNPNLANRDQELARLYGEAARRYAPLVEKHPEFENVHLARFSWATALHQLGSFREAAAVLDAIPEPERSGRLAAVSYLLADCLIRTLPADAADALAAAQLSQQLERAIKLLDGFSAAYPKNPETPDALLKLGFCQQQLAGVMAEPEERKKILAIARQVYERLIQQFGNHPLQPTAVFERARCIADTGDVNGAINELTRFQNDPLRQAPVAPLAWLRLAALVRAQGKPADAVKILEQCRAQYEGALLKDAARAGWAPLVQYHLGVALRDSGKLADAATVFEGITKQFAARPEALDAAWRLGQCRREAAQDKLQLAGQVLAKRDAKPDELTAARTARQQALADLQTIAQYFQGQAGSVAAKAAGSEPHLRTLYEAAWCHRTLADQEIEVARSKLEQDALKKRQDELAKQAAAVGEPVPVAHIAELPPTAIPVQPAEQKARENYQQLIAAGSANALAQAARLELAELHARRLEFKAAIPLLVEAIDTDPAPDLAARLRLRLGACHQAQGQIADAAAQYDAVAQMPGSPYAPEARYRAGECLIEQKEWAKAIAQLLPFKDQQPLHNIAGISDRALLALGRACAAASQWEPSRQALETLVSRHPQSAWNDEARYGIGWAWQNQRQFDQAVGAYQQVVARTTSEVAARAQLQIGLCRLEQNRHSEAANALLVVPFTYDYPEWNAVALCEASRAFVALKQPEQAGRLLDRVLKDHPDSRWAEVARQRRAEIR